MNNSFKYILFHKPYGVNCQFTGDLPNLSQFGLPPNVYSVGRLDKDSEGLLLLTDDGPLKHRLTDPKFFKEKTYWVQVEKIPTDEALEQLASGVEIKGYKTRACRVKKMPETFELPPRNPPIRERKSIPTCWLEIVLTEGKNRQVRRMTAKVGHPTLRLIRVGLGETQLENLEPGEWIEINRQSIFKHS